MLKKASLTLSLLVLMSALLSPTTMAENSDPTYTTAKNAKIVTEKEEKKLSEKNANTNKIYFEESDDVELFSEDPGIGATDVVPYAYGNGTIIIEDDESGTFNVIKDIAMTVAGIFVDRVGGVVLDIAEMLGEAVAPEKYARAKTMKSYRYIGKEGRVYTGSSWGVYWDTRSREIYKHYFASFSDPEGYTHTDTKDYTRPNGYGPVTTNWSEHYFDDDYIEQTAYNNWKYNRYWVVETGY